MQPMPHASQMHAFTRVHRQSCTHMWMHMHQSQDTLNASSCERISAPSHHIITLLLSPSHTQHTRMPPRKKQAPQQQQQQAAPFTRLLDCDDVLGKVYASCTDRATKQALRVSCSACYRWDDLVGMGAVSDGGVHAQVLRFWSEHNHLMQNHSLSVPATCSLQPVISGMNSLLPGIQQATTFALYIQGCHALSAKFQHLAARLMHHLA